MNARSRVPLSAIAGLACAVGTAWYQRVGAAPPEWDQELCSFQPPRSCREGVLVGGWPFPYLVDRPGVSVVGKITIIGEDDFHPVPFAADAIVLGGLIYLLVGIGRRSTVG